MSQKETPPGGGREQSAEDVADLGNAILAAMEKWGKERGQRIVRDTVPLTALSMVVVRNLSLLAPDRRRTLVEVFIDDLRRKSSN